MTVARFFFLLPAVLSVTGLLLSTTVAFAQEAKPEDRKKNCRVLSAKRGESAREVPDEELNPGRAGNFPYLIDDTHLRADFQVDREKRRECMSFFGIQNAASAAGAAAAAAAAPGGVATVGAGIGAGIGAVSAGALAVGGLVVITTGAAIGLASGGGSSGQTNSTTSTTNAPP